MALNFAKLPRAAQRAAFAHMGDKGKGRFSGKLKADKPSGHGRFSGTLPDDGRGKFAGTLPTEKRSLGTGGRHADLTAKAGRQPPGQRQIDDLHKAYKDGHDSGELLSGGVSADKVEKLKLSNGQAAVRKTQTPRDTRAEYLSGRVANALGIKDVTVAQTGDRETVAAFVKGAPGVDEMKRAMDKARFNKTDALDAEVKRQTKLNNGREIGMLDWLIDNDDRHELNWMVSPDGKSVVPIDHGSANFDLRAYDKNRVKVPRSPFVNEWIRPEKDDFDIFSSADPQWTPGELTKIRASIEGLKSEFSSAEEQRWHAFMLSRLDTLEGK